MKYGLSTDDAPFEEIYSNIGRVKEQFRFSPQIK
mgnify:FL=1